MSAIVGQRVYSHVSVVTGPKSYIGSATVGLGRYVTVSVRRAGQQSRYTPAAREQEMLVLMLALSMTSFAHIQSS
jgi:hypothetical protein